MDIQNLIAEGGNVQLVINVNDLKEICSYLYNEERIRQEKQKEQENDGLLDSKEVKEMLNVKNETLWRWNQNGYLPHVKIGCRNYYRREDVDKILGKKGKHEVD